MRSLPYTIRVATPQEDSIIAEHFCLLWHDIISVDAVKSDWREITLEFIERVRQDLSYQAFVAEVDSKVVGSVGCQLFAGLYPNVLTEQYRKSGYIWGVYVEPAYRRQGIAKKLTLESLNYLKSLGCTRALLHASPLGQPVYSSLGFTPSNEMCFDLR
ncbi:GCN5-related N-acetyltransferase [Gloeocapsa sp. PCC 7428]|uniref:GNAT family N-acetyltransferase n=1 Tax=Gloeocapsa sp. PCC 7428 TaxID=1173026 RepID=UPI0002A5F2C1|nr:GNAT family N-acetyltransferase [Gloeocapsa sp. PCC 7428]AFZ29845.1 GCN5-related N-acetyltransferase [Gloeocapsa sp. PCC 7428]